MVHKQVKDYWAEHVKSRALNYTTLEYLTVNGYYPGNKHWLLQHSGIAREIPTETEDRNRHLHTTGEQIYFQPERD